MLQFKYVLERGDCSNPRNLTPHEDGHGYIEPFDQHRIRGSDVYRQWRRLANGTFFPIFGRWQHCSAEDFIITGCSENFFSPPVSFNVFGFCSVLRLYTCFNDPFTL